MDVACATCFSWLCSVGRLFFKALEKKKKKRKEKIPSREIDWWEVSEFRLRTDIPTILRIISTCNATAT